MYQIAGIVNAMQNQQITNIRKRDAQTASSLTQCPTPAEQQISGKSSSNATIKEPNRGSVDLARIENSTSCTSPMYSDFTK